jgi:hypothetical protein
MGTTWTEHPYSVSDLILPRPSRFNIYFIVSTKKNESTIVLSLSEGYVHAELCDR